MMFFTKILIICIAFGFSFAFEFPQNAHNAEIACMFESKRLQSEWSEQDWEFCKEKFIGLDTLLPHAPITLQSDRNKATLLFITSKNNKILMLLLNNDTLRIAPNIIDEFNKIESVFFTSLDNTKHICVIDNVNNLHTTTCYEIQIKDTRVALSIFPKVVDFECRGACKEYNADSIKQFLSSNPQGFVTQGL